ncbi:MAG TPA: PspC domain-containing protein [Patescibacteria group bacterium]|nr:PspC domain-containing protein [Patescibacteria group bacterium]
MNKKETAPKGEKKTTSASSKLPKLHRSETDRVLAGIAGGLGEYFHLDPVVIRLIFIVLFLQGAGFLLYLILWIVIPTQSKLEKSSQEIFRDNAQEIKDKAEAWTADLRAQGRRQNTQLWFGILVIFLGLWLLLENFGFFSFFRLEKFWPLLLILLGMAILNKRENEQG